MLHTKNGGSVEKNPEHSECEHSRSLYLLWISQPSNGVIEHEAQAEEEHESRDQSAKKAEATVSEGVARCVLSVR